MATAEQIKMLIKAHYDKNEDRFRTVVLQLAAYEAKMGHQSVARDIREILEKSRIKTEKVIPFNRELNDLVISDISDKRFIDLVVNAEIKKRIERILLEYWQRDKLKKYGLNNRRKILLAGQPGTGKTLTASVLAGETSLPLCTIVTDKLVTKYMGETSVKLRQIFDFIKENPAVYLFDEFDTIGTERSLENDVGEIRRVLNSFLQFIEQDDSESIIVAATNNPKLLDQALFRRFDDTIYYKSPDKEQIERLIKNKIGKFKLKNLSFKKIIEKSMYLNHADISKACDDAVKEAILNDLGYITEDLILKMLDERKEAYKRGEI
ncbi:AAA family ATPase [Bacillus paranthracis]|uniref:AAA family ATPase n=1 Tax=Bacillus paranthracis TaxID=2026186 RepID=UPI0021CEE4AE|nr:ATP-binding protein [Bacillus paranthracis]MCU5469858.1 ATP-binding protein [Bacillus paranthracis]